MKKVSGLAWSALALSSVVVSACDSSDDGGVGGEGGEVSASGGRAAGGSASGGKGSASGGKTGSHVGGQQATGGHVNAGGAAHVGGHANAGGHANTGGKIEGSGGMGGEPSTGGVAGVGGNVAASGGAPTIACADFPESPLPMGGASAMGGASGEDFVLASPSFDYCDPIPAESTCDGHPFGTGASPHLEWTPGPAETMSYAVVFKDLSLTEGNAPGSFQYNRAFHWVVWDIPADVVSLPGGIVGGHFPTEVDGARQWGVRSNYGYLGSCPNYDPAQNTDLTDSYSFTLYALPTEVSDIPEKSVNNWTLTMAEYLESVAIAKTELRGTSNAKASEAPPTLGTLVYPCPTSGTATVDCVPPQL